MSETGALRLGADQQRGGLARGGLTRPADRRDGQDGVHRAAEIHGLIRLVGRFRGNTMKVAGRARPGWGGAEAAAGRGREYQLAAWAAGDPEGALVDQAMVVAAELDEIVQVGRSAVSPVMDVVGVDVAGLAATGELDATVAAGEGPGQGGGGRGGLAADGHGFAVALDD